MPRDERAKAPIEEGRADRLHVGEVEAHTVGTFQRFESRLDLIVDDDDLRRDDPPAHRALAGGVERVQSRVTVGATSMAGRRSAPDARAAPIVAKASPDCSTTSPAWSTMRQHHPFFVEIARTSIQTL